jgi:hypothetical protein
MIVEETPKQIRVVGSGMNVEGLRKEMALRTLSSGDRATTS